MARNINELRTKARQADGKYRREMVYGDTWEVDVQWQSAQQCGAWADWLSSLSVEARDEVNAIVPDITWC